MPDDDLAEPYEPVERSWRERWFPFWFPDDLHPQLEENKWLIVVGTYLVPGFVFWGPYLLIKPRPDVPMGELLINIIVKTFTAGLGSMFILGAYAVLATTCPPYLGAYIWYVPLVVASSAWSLMHAWQAPLVALIVWDEALKKQGTPEQPPPKRRSRRKQAAR